MTKDAGGAKTHRALLFSIFQCFGTTELLVSSYAGSLDANHFLRWVHARTVALTREILSVLAEMSQHRTSEYFKTGFVLIKGQMLGELGTGQLQHACLTVFAHSERDCTFCTYSFVCSDVWFLNGASFFPVMLKTVIRWITSTKALPGLALQYILRLRALTCFVYSHLWNNQFREQLSLPPTTLHCYSEWLLRFSQRSGLSRCLKMKMEYDLLLSWGSSLLVGPWAGWV